MNTNESAVERVWEAIGAHSAQVATTGNLAPSIALVDAMKDLAALLPSAADEPLAWISSEQLASLHALPQMDRTLRQVQLRAAKCADSTVPLFTRPASARPSAGAGEVVAWSRTDYIRDRDGTPIGMDEPRVVWGSEHPDPEEGGWHPMYFGPEPAVPVAPAAEGLTDAQCDAVYQAVMMSGLTRDVKSPERKREIVREALSPAQPEAK